MAENFKEPNIACMKGLLPSPYFIFNILVYKVSPRLTVAIQKNFDESVLGKITFPKWIYITVDSVCLSPSHVAAAQVRQDNRRYECDYVIPHASEPAFRLCPMTSAANR